VRRITGLMLALIMIAAISCKSGKKYSEIREFINEVVTTQDEFLSNIDKSVRADDVVSAVDAFGMKLMKLSEKSTEIRRKYPEVDKWINDPPDELKMDFNRLNDTESKFKKIFVGEKIKILIRDKKVQDAFKELNRRMESVKFFQ